MPANPSRFLISNDWDPKTSLREWCTCPHCLVVWTHKETMHDKADWDWAKAHYSEPTTCSECQTISVPIRKDERKSLPFRMRNEKRRIIGGPETDSEPNPVETTEPPPGRRPPWWSRKSREEREP